MSASRLKKEVDTSTYRGRFAVRLTELRLKAKLTVEELGEKSGIPYKSIYNWESTRNEPLLSHLPKLAEALGVKIGKLLPEK